MLGCPVLRRPVHSNYMLIPIEEVAADPFNYNKVVTKATAFKL